MQKSTFEAFVKRYSLGGVCEAAHWYSDAQTQTLTAKAHTETKTVILKVTLKKWEGVESCQLALPSSTKIKSMLGPIGEEITISLNKIRDRVSNFVISDKDCEAVCTVAEFDAFPESFDVDTESDNVPTVFDVEMKLTEDFVQRLMRAIAALSEAKDFVLLNNKKGGLDMVINYEDTNTNRIRLPVTTVDGKDKMTTTMGFSTEVLKAIVSANQTQKRMIEVTDPDGKVSKVPAPVIDPVLRVSDRGIAIIEYDDKLFRSKYFMFPTRVID